MLENLKPRLMPRDAEMQRVNEFAFYELALKIHGLTEVDDSQSVKYSAIWLHWSNARDAVNEIYRQRPLNFTTPAANALYRAITEVVPEKWEDMIAKLPKHDEGASESDLPPWAVYRVKEAAREFETVLRNECFLMDTYFVTKKGTYSTVDLVERAHYHIPEPTRASLPDLTKRDLDQAGKCMAFDVPTAAAFHLLRGTEAVIREYYLAVVPGPKQASPKMRNWGTYIRLLKNHDGDPKVIALLTHMKDMYRNPVIHPEEIYDDQRVQVLFGLCVSAIVVIKNAEAELATKTMLIPFKPASGAASA